MKKLILITLAALSYNNNTNSGTLSLLIAGGCAGATYYYFPSQEKVARNIIKVKNLLSLGLNDAAQEVNHHANKNKTWWDKAKELVGSKDPKRESLNEVASEIQHGSDSLDNIKPKQINQFTKNYYKAGKFIASSVVLLIVNKILK